MSKIVRPIQFDERRKRRRNARANAAARKRRDAERERRKRFELIWLGVEPTKMWDIAFGEAQNDNKKGPHRCT